jgi:dTDP-4-amino-4,6-dideoxygalactose transaminase
VIEDAACAAGSEIEWRGHWQRIGRPHGDVACFSFHPRKVVTTGDGGMLTTSDPELDRQFRLRRQHGMSISDTTRHQSPQVLFETYPIVGFNYRLTDIQAAIGRQQLARLPLLVDQRRQLARGYMARVGAIADLTLPVEPAWARSNWQSYCVRLPPGVDQRRVMQAMLNHGIATRRGIMCAHREPAYRDTPSRHRLTVSEAAQDHCILLPLYAGMSVGDQDIVVDALAAALQAERASRDSTRMLATT